MRISSQARLDRRGARLAIAAFLALAAGVMPAAAQKAAAPAAAPAAPAAPAQISPAHMDLARKLVVANGEVRAFEGIIPNIVESAERVFVQTNPDLAKPLREVAIVVVVEFENRKAEITDILAASYARHFSEAELKEAIAFYSSPTGVKLVVDRPVIVQEAVQGIQIWGAQMNQLAMDRIRTEMKKRGVDL